jgi:hypothetical protein
VPVAPEIVSDGLALKGRGERIEPVGERLGALD